MNKVDSIKFYRQILQDIFINQSFNEMNFCRLDTKNPLEIEFLKYAEISNWIEIENNSVSHWKKVNITEKGICALLNITGKLVFGKNTEFYKRELNALIHIVYGIATPKDYFHNLSDCKFNINNKKRIYDNEKLVKYNFLNDLTNKKNYFLLKKIIPNLKFNDYESSYKLSQKIVQNITKNTREKEMMLLKKEIEENQLSLF